MGIHFHHPLVWTILWSSQLVIIPPKSLASSNGIAGYSGNPSTNEGKSCLSCHKGDLGPEVYIEGPSFLKVEETATFTLVIEGQSGLFGSLDLSASSGELISTDESTKIKNFELVHRKKKEIDSSGRTSFDFSWKAPATPGKATMFGAGLLSNGTGTSGDGLGASSFDIEVTQ